MRLKAEIDKVILEIIRRSQACTEENCANNHVKDSKKLLALFESAMNETLGKELEEAKMMNKHYSDKGTPNPFYQGQVIVLTSLRKKLKEML